MVLFSEEYINAWLDKFGSGTPSEYYVRFFFDVTTLINPTNEVDAVDYVPVELINNGTNFIAASGGIKQIAVDVLFPVSAAGYSAPVPYWGLSEAETGDLVFFASLDAPINVTAGKAAQALANTLKIRIQPAA